MLSEEQIHYAEKAYPSNHTFKIKSQHLKPKCKLLLRYRKIKQLYPKPLTSLLDISCSKGFFVFSAIEDRCQRSLGIDINDYDIHFCLQLKKHLGHEHVDFVKLRLHELAERIDEFGGPFQTLLIINAYQYFYFGSDRAKDCYLDHELIFDYLNKICSQRIIFNNRITLSDCQNQKHVQSHTEAAKKYCPEDLVKAASRYFKFTEQGHIGRYPLWTFDKC